ncbi:unnamed protein product [Auanema sp. JU1783]|nr:unnamed protein product [Auanema sp. JU1783]
MVSNENVTEYMFPEMDWCFDIEVYYSSSAGHLAVPMAKSFKEYKNFSYRYNGVITMTLVTLGLTGSILLLIQIYGSRVFSKRLAVHLGMICIWDSLYLLSCLATYGIPSFIYGMPPTYGTMAYILFILQPFASFCVSCTIWQVLAIAVERYWAVTKPLEQRTRKAKFGVFWICACIIIGASVLNLLPIPFERFLVPCFEIKPTKQSRYRLSTLLKPYNSTSSRQYKFVVHFLPDIIFRAPLPIIILTVLTIKTIIVCNQRTVGNLHINAHMKRNIPLRLSLLNFKFILCNMLYMFNTLLLELLGYGETVEDPADGDIDRFMNTYYLTDASNLLLVIHSTTNWLLFYHWPSFNKQRQSLKSVTITTSKNLFVRPRVADYVIKSISSIRSSLGTDIIITLCNEYSQLSEAFIGSQELSIEHPNIKIIGDRVGLFIEQVLRWISNKGRGDNIREMGRRLGEANFYSNVHFTVEEWKDVRTTVVSIIVKYTLRDQGFKSMGCTPYEINDMLTRAFNLVLSEMRNGTLCAAVEANMKTYRSQSQCEWTYPREIPRKTRSVSFAPNKKYNQEESPPLITSTVI